MHLRLQLYDNFLKYFFVKPVIYTFEIAPYISIRLLEGCFAQVLQEGILMEVNRECCTQIKCDIWREDQVLLIRDRILFSCRLFHIKRFSYTKVLGDRFPDDSDVSADFTRNIFALIQIFCESCFESLLEFYRRLFHYDLCVKIFPRSWRGILMTCENQNLHRRFP